MNIIINALGPSKVKAGIGNYITNLISELALLDLENKYIIYASAKNKQFYETSNRNFIVKDIGIMGRNKFLRILWEQLVLPIKSLIIRADILFSPGFVCPFIKTSKNVLVIHDMTFFSHPQVHTFFKRIYFPFMIKRSIARSEKIISVSYNTKNEILKYSTAIKDDIVVTHLAANNISNIEIGDEKGFLEKKYNINGDFLLFVGMIEPRKNINLIIEALEEINDSEIKFVVVGQKGWMIKDLYEKISEKKLEDRILFTGFVPDDELQIFYKNAKIFLYPSLYEGFGIPVLEAMSAGCCVITSNISSLPEVAGDAAILINPTKVEELKDAIDLLLSNDNLRNELIIKGFENCKKFSWKNTAEQTLNVFRELQI